MKAFTLQTRDLFLEMLPAYLGTAHSKAGTKIETKSDGTPVGDLDRYTLQRMRELIQKNFADDYILGEEDGMSADEIRAALQRQDQNQSTCDGLDGTGNFRMGTTSFGATISRRFGGDVIWTALFRPVDERLYGNGFYYAERGNGSWQWCCECDIFHQLSTAPASKLERLVVMLEGSSKKFFRPPIASLGQTITTRPGFSSCVAATTVAQGLAGALVTVDNKPWDNWPSWLLIQEAGGVVTDWHGNPCTPENCGNMIAAANGDAHANILKFLAA